MFAANMCLRAPPAGAVSYNSDLNWSSGSLPGVVTHTGGANGTRMDATGNIVAASAGRLDYDPSHNCRGAYAEGARTNVCFPSADLSSGNFYVDNGAITVNTVVSPDGGTNADVLVGSSVVAGEVCVGVNNILTTGNVVLAAYWKVASVRPTNFAGFMHLGATGINGYASSVRNISTGAAGSTSIDGSARGTVINGGAVSHGNGWWRAWQTGKTTDTPYQTFQFQLSDAGTPGGGYDSFGQPLFTGQLSADLWGLDVQLGDGPSSHIPAPSAATTRSADVITWTDAANLACRAFTCEAYAALFRPLTGTQIIYQWQSGASDYWRVELDGSGFPHVKIVTGGVTRADMVGSVAISPGARFKIAFNIAVGASAASFMGAAVVTSTPSAIPTPTGARGGSDTAGANYGFCILARVRGATAMTNSQLVSEAT